MFSKFVNFVPIDLKIGMHIDLASRRLYLIIIIPILVKTWPIWN